MKYKTNYVDFIILQAIICCCGHVLAQIPVRKGPASSVEIKKALTIVKVNMDSVKAHRTYIYAMGLSNPLLMSQYNTWIKKYPSNPVIPLTIGAAYYNAEMPQAKEFLLKAAEIEPQDGRIWTMLAGDADMRGQKTLSKEYIRKAALTDTSNVDYACAYLISLRDGQPADYKQKAFDFVKRFPASERGAQILYWLAEDATNPDEKVADLEQLRKLYPPQNFTWSSSGMIGLADAYLQKDPEKALILIKEMGDGKDWKIRKQIAELLIKIDLKEKNQIIMMLLLN